ncbi:MAG TPA: hypothetical protein VI564_00020 [Candidatus Nanoarchaeia archaeon]|nr:hypothetical protein [Candidatus Nanoarchaeia archaeon]
MGNYEYRHVPSTGYAFKYPKFLLMFLTIFLAYEIFYGKTYPPFHDFVLALGYFGAFFAGMMYTYGFTAASAVSILMIMAPHQNIAATGIIAGFGALAGDLLIFKFVRSSFSDEVERLRDERIVKLALNKIPAVIIKPILYLATIFVIASPLPDEIGVTMLAALKELPTKLFIIISYVLNTVGILVVLLIGKGL